MDGTDRELISLLRKDARTPIAALASRLKVSRPTSFAVTDGSTSNSRSSVMPTR